MRTEWTAFPSRIALTVVTPPALTAWYEMPAGPCTDCASPGHGPAAAAVAATARAPTSSPRSLVPRRPHRRAGGGSEAKHPAAADALRPAVPGAPRGRREQAA